MTGPGDGGTSPGLLGFSTRWHRLSAELPDGVAADVVLECGWEARHAGGTRRP